MSNTYFRFRHTFLLSVHSSQSHATWCLNLMSHHWINNKCNRVKGWRWRWLIYALCNFYFVIICSVFPEVTTTVLESFTNSTEKHLCWTLFFSLKWWNYIKVFVLHDKPYFCRIFILKDWHHKWVKNTIDLLLFYGEFFNGFLESDLRKLQKKNIHFTTNISIYTGQRHFEVLWSFIL